MKVAIFGATGTAGKALVKAAIERNFEVKALVRTPSKLGDLINHIEVIKGDYLNKELTLKTIEGTDAVLSTVGPPPGRKHGIQPQDFEEAMLGLINNMHSCGLKRIINITSAATSYEGEKISFSRKIDRFLANLVAPVMTPSKERELKALMASSLDWTSIRVAFISPRAKGTFSANAANKVAMKVNDAQLAHFMLDSITSKEWIKKAPFVGTK